MAFTLQEHSSFVVPTLLLYFYFSERFFERISDYFVGARPKLTVFSLFPTTSFRFEIEKKTRKIFALLSIAFTIGPFNVD